ncbi:hypothetical protein [Microbacterium aquimaris]|uniref:Uncharacterized protein n=1 Tax=Microbacterium aquimaris TaxID=459816 RepID=A0ABU5N5B3_9MICO|nr:hypothetical protein [Microbacterium aquimaris]MDZ8161267.1 hypothetical protein [Microbacterium aquimaris]
MSRQHDPSDVQGDALDTGADDVSAVSFDNGTRVVVTAWDGEATVTVSALDGAAALAVERFLADGVWE